MANSYKAGAGFWSTGGRVLRCVSLALLGTWPCLVAAEGVSSAPPYLGERLVYQVSYHGALSGQASVDIADAVLETKSNAETFNGVPAYRSALQVSTEDYPAVEGFYPFRYRFQSYYSTDLARALYIDVRKISRKDQSEIVWFDWDGGTVERYKKRGKVAEGRGSDAPAILAAADALNKGYRHNAKDDLRLNGALLDRLSLLQVVRAQELLPGKAIRFSVSDGKVLYSYRVQVLGREPLEQDGQVWDTHKLSFDGFEQGNAERQPEHAPVFIWLTADRHKLPVRFSSEAVLGTFRIDLRTVNGQPAKELAGDQLAVVP